MASIKERAAALNLAEKLCARSVAHRVTSTSTQVSSLWHDLVFYLRSSVTVKDRRVHLKTYSDCFLGSEAVDVVTEHINTFKHLVGVNLSRDKVVCVCQALLDCRVFELVGTKVFGNDKKHSGFQDSKSAFYRFVNIHMPSANEVERILLVNGVQTLFCGPCSDQTEDQICSTGSRVQMCTPVKFTQIAPKASQLETCTTGSLALEPVVHGMSPSRAQAGAVVPQPLSDELWQEQTLLRLLNLVELPLLEGILHCMQISSSPPSQLHEKTDLIYTSNQLDRQILRVFRDTQEDEWLCAALDCLDFLPDLPVVELSRELPQFFLQYEKGCETVPVQPLISISTSNQSSDEQLQYSQTGLTRCKLLLYRTLVKHYSQADRPPLLPQLMTDIYTAIIDLLTNAKLSTALEALQLCLKLLPHGCREQLRRLLTFMALAADPQGIKLDNDVENRQAVVRSFSRAIVHKSLSKEKGGLMVVFMLSNVEEIFKIPGALHKVVSDKLASIGDGKPPNETGLTVCQQVSSRNYTDLTGETTNQELWALLKSIHLDTKISEKERKRLLRQFCGAHPQIFSQYFGDSAISVL
ncbi:DEP domain-containing protein 7-like isoform X2 [Betta splendens]|uniref:DEP domain-containing protein 7 n=1 Tax=Betta splendens TaxID=158456 RepID=A0A6P7MSA0_BETSP|nr:DEP domain-containing protein 7-like isoform X2 [Betta splendens]